MLNAFMCALMSFISGGLLSLATGRMAPVREITATTWPLAAHITLSALAFGLLGTAALLALVLAVQDQGLRSRRPATWRR